jgi:TolB protein
MKDNGSVIYQLTGGTTFESYPSWQPGGRKIIFASEGVNPANLYSLDVSWLGGATPNPTPAPVQLPNQAGITEKASPHYSPDKDWVVYSALDANHHRRIFVMSTDTTGSTRMQLGGDPTSNESDPDWSPDGKTVIFISDRAGNPDIYTMDMRFLYNPDPQHNVPPPHSLNGATAAFESSPVFSPVDQRIVFISRIGP